MTPPLTTLEEHACHGGVQGFYEHASQTIGLPMRFGVYRPPGADARKLPVVFCLAGLTCNHETFAIKAGAQQHAARHGLILVTPDTSPRSTGIEGAGADWEFGEAASFYLDATEPPWNRHWRMESYLIDELRDLVLQRFDGDPQRVGILGHSMGGHGALTLAIKHPLCFRSVSALAPICAPMQAPWGIKALGGYLGGDAESNREAWAAHDASVLVETKGRIAPILIDQGLADKFLGDQLLPDAFETACRAVDQPLTLRRHERYDHSYWFIASFIGDHVAHHAQLLSSAT